MRRTLRTVAFAAILGALMLPTEVGAQLDARDNPTKKGPLVRDGQRCKRDRERFAGRLAAVSRSCSDVFSFDPEQEDKARRDYGAVWLQATVDSAPGWCARETVMKIRVPRGVRIEERTPTFKRADEPRRVRSRIVVDADGTADQNGVVKNHYRLYPNRLKPDLEGRTLTVDWRGNSPKTLGFAIGVEISWNTDAGFPDQSPRGSVVSSLISC